MENEFKNRRGEFMKSPKRGWIYTVLTASFILGFAVACGNRNQNPNNGGVVAPVGPGFGPGFVPGGGAPVAVASGSHPEGIQLTMQFLSTGGVAAPGVLAPGMGMQVLGQMIVTRNPTLGCQLPPGPYTIQAQSPVQIGTGFAVSDMLLIVSGPVQVQAYFTQVGLFSSNSGAQFTGVPGFTGQTMGLSGQLIFPSCMIPNFTIAP